MSSTNAYHFRSTSSYKNKKCWPSQVKLQTTLLWYYKLDTNSNFIQIQFNKLCIYQVTYAVCAGQNYYWTLSLDLLLHIYWWLELHYNCFLSLSVKVKSRNMEAKSQKYIIKSELFSQESFTNQTPNEKKHIIAVSYVGMLCNMIKWQFRKPWGLGCYFARKIQKCTN